MSQVRAMRYTLERVIRGLDTISATGNILRDYLTDLFPIMELGTSRQDALHRAFDGGWRHVREPALVARPPSTCSNWWKKTTCVGIPWVSSLALAVSLEDLGLKTGNAKAKVLAKTLDAATGKLLDNNKNPSPRQVSWTTVAASSTWPCTGHKSWLARRKMPLWQPSLHRWRRSSQRKSLPSLQNWLPFRAVQWISAVILAQCRQAGRHHAP